MNEVNRAQNAGIVMPMTDILLLFWIDFKVSGRNETILWEGEKQNGIKLPNQQKKRMASIPELAKKYTHTHTRIVIVTLAHIYANWLLIHASNKNPMTNRIINLWFLHVLQVHWHTINDMIDRCCECWVCARMCVRTICCIIHFYIVCNDTFIGSTLFASLLAHLISSALYSTRFTWAIFKKKEPSLQCVAFYKFSQHVLVHSKTKLNVSILCLLFQLKILNIKLTECLCVCVCVSACDKEVRPRWLCVCLYVAAANSVYVRFCVWC